jgi:hypothetical protein
MRSDRRPLWCRHPACRVRGGASTSCPLSVTRCRLEAGATPVVPRQSFTAMDVRIHSLCYSRPRSPSRTTRCSYCILGRCSHLEWLDGEDGGSPRGWRMTIVVQASLPASRTLDERLPLALRLRHVGLRAGPVLRDRCLACRAGGGSHHRVASSPNAEHAPVARAPRARPAKETPANKPAVGPGFTPGRCVRPATTSRSRYSIDRTISDLPAPPGHLHASTSQPQLFPTP